jgi:hypothetical protein
MRVDGMVGSAYQAMPRAWPIFFATSQDAIGLNKLNLNTRVDDVAGSIG